MFARAYTQYIAERTGDARMAEYIRGQNAEDNAYKCQWERNDFKPVADAFDAMFAAKGWRT